MASVVVMPRIVGARVSEIHRILTLETEMKDPFEKGARSIYHIGVRCVYIHHRNAPKAQGLRTANKLGIYRTP